MAKFVYTQSAVDDLQDILDYTRSQWGSEQAAAYLDGLEKQAELLANMPALGRFYPPYKEKQVRVFPYEKHLIYYIEASAGIILMHITHEGMDQEGHLRATGFDNPDFCD